MFLTKKYNFKCKNDKNKTYENQNKNIIKVQVFFLKDLCLIMLFKSPKWWYIWTLAISQNYKTFDVSSNFGKTRFTIYLLVYSRF